MRRQGRLSDVAIATRSVLNVLGHYRDVYYSNVRLGQIDERILKVEDALGRRMRNPQV